MKIKATLITDKDMIKNIIAGNSIPIYDEEEEEDNDEYWNFEDVIVLPEIDGVINTLDGDVLMYEPRSDSYDEEVYEYGAEHTADVILRRVSEKILGKLGKKSEENGSENIIIELDDAGNVKFSYDFYYDDENDEMTCTGIGNFVIVKEEYTRICLFIQEKNISVTEV